MGKRGGSKHIKRIASPKAVAIHDKKAHTWLMKAMPGPHPLNKSVPLGVLLRDILGLAKTAREAKRILSEGKVVIDGKIRKKARFPVGLMDIVSFPSINRHYRIVVDNHGKLVPEEIKEEERNQKTAKVVRKRTIKKGKIAITLHDGRNMIADNNIKVGDSVIIEVPTQKLLKHLKMKKGATCLITEGKHAGKTVVLNEILSKAGLRKEALVKHDKEEFITVADYLFVVGEENA